MSGKVACSVLQLTVYQGSEDQVDACQAVAHAIMVVALGWRSVRAVYEVMMQHALGLKTSLPRDIAS